MKLITLMADRINPKQNKTPLSRLYTPYKKSKCHDTGGGGSWLYRWKVQWRKLVHGSREQVGKIIWVAFDGVCG